jgi:hypothetical protein
LHASVLQHSTCKDEAAKQYHEAAKQNDEAAKQYHESAKLSDEAAKV